MAAPRDVRKSAEADAQHTELFGSLERADEMTRGLELALAMSPEQGMPVPGTDLWAILFENYVEFPIIVYYRFDARIVDIVSVMEVGEIENTYGEDEE